MEEVPASPEKQKPGSRVAIRVSVKVSGWIALEWAFGQLGRITDHRLAFFGHFTDFLLIVGVGSGHHQGYRTGIHEGSSDFVQLFEIGTQSLIGLRSCAASDGDLVSFSGLGNFLCLHTFNLEAGRVERFAHGSAGQLGFAFGGYESGSAGKEHFVHAFNLGQGRTGLFSSSSPTAAEGYRVSGDSSSRLFHCRTWDRESRGGHSAEGTHDTESDFCIHSRGRVNRLFQAASEVFIRKCNKKELRGRTSGAFSGWTR